MSWADMVIYGYAERKRAKMVNVPKLKSILRESTNNSFVNLTFRLKFEIAVVKS